MKNKQTLHRALFIDQTIASFTLSQIFGQIIKQKLAQQQAAGQATKKKLQLVLRDVGISQPTWSRLMSGKSSITLDKMSELCDGLAVDMMTVLAEVLSLSKKLSASNNASNYANLGIVEYFPEYAGPSIAASNQYDRRESSRTAASKDMLRHFIEQVKNDDNSERTRA